MITAKATASSPYINGYIEAEGNAGYPHGYNWIALRTIVDEDVVWFIRLTVSESNNKSPHSGLWNSILLSTIENEQSNQYSQVMAKVFRAIVAWEKDNSGV